MNFLSKLAPIGCCTSLLMACNNEPEICPTLWRSDALQLGAYAVVDSGNLNLNALLITEPVAMQVVSLSALDSGQVVIKFSDFISDSEHGRAGVMVVNQGMEPVAGAAIMPGLLSAFSHATPNDFVDFRTVSASSGKFSLDVDNERVTVSATAKGITCSTSISRTEQLYLVLFIGQEVLDFPSSVEFTISQVSCSGRNSCTDQFNCGSIE